MTPAETQILRLALDACAECDAWHPPMVDPAGPYVLADALQEAGWDDARAWFLMRATGESEPWWGLASAAPNQTLEKSLHRNGDTRRSIQTTRRRALQRPKVILARAVAAVLLFGEWPLSTPWKLHRTSTYQDAYVMIGGQLITAGVAFGRGSEPQHFARELGRVFTRASGFAPPPATPLTAMNVSVDFAVPASDMAPFFDALRAAEMRRVDAQAGALADIAPRETDAELRDRCIEHLRAIRGPELQATLDRIAQHQRARR